MGQWNERMYESMRPGHAARESYVCGKCVSDDALGAFVEHNATQSKCDFCGTRQDAPFAASLGDVIDHMAECIAQEYTNPAEELPYETAEGGWQGDVLDAWDLLETVGFAVESEQLFEEVVSAFNQQEWCHRDYFSLDPSQRLRYGWDAFKNAVKHERRFTFWSMEDRKREFDPDYMPVGRILAVIGDCIRNADLVKTFPQGQMIWRVRVHDASITLTADHQLSPPPVEKALQPNRMSPAGIVMFYGADDFETACAETVDAGRARGKSVTGAEFRTLRNMRLLDLIDLPKMPSFFQLGTLDYRHTILFLRHFASDVAVPVVRDGHEHIEYVPTQAFTEYVRYELKLHDGAKIDGIRYKSAMNGKPCFVLFCTHDECVANPSSRRRHERWLALAPTSLRTIDARYAASGGAEAERGWGLVD